MAQDVEEAFGDEFGADVRGGAVDEHDELVAAHPADGVGVSQGGLQAGGDRGEEPVAGLVAQGVVDVFELVEIDVQGGAEGARATVAGQELFDAVHDQRPVGQPGQRVM